MLAKVIRQREHGGCRQPMRVTVPIEQVLDADGTMKSAVLLGFTGGTHLLGYRTVVDGAAVIELDCWQMDTVGLPMSRVAHVELLHGPQGMVSTVLSVMDGGAFFYVRGSFEDSGVTHRFFVCLRSPLDPQQQQHQQPVRFVTHYSLESSPSSSSLALTMIATASGWIAMDTGDDIDFVFASSSVAAADGTTRPPLLVQIERSASTLWNIDCDTVVRGVPPFHIVNLRFMAATFIGLYVHEVDPALRLVSFSLELLCDVRQERSVAVFAELVCRQPGGGRLAIGLIFFVSYESGRATIVASCRGPDLQGFRSRAVEIAQLYQPPSPYKAWTNANVLKGVSLQHIDHPVWPIRLLGFPPPAQAVTTISSAHVDQPNLPRPVHQRRTY